MGWQKIFMDVDMNPLEGMTSSLEGCPRGLLVWLIIKIPTEVLMMWIRGDKR